MLEVKLKSDINGVTEATSDSGNVDTVTICETLDNSQQNLVKGTCDHK